MCMATPRLLFDLSLWEEQLFFPSADLNSSRQHGTVRDTLSTLLADTVAASSSGQSVFMIDLGVVAENVDAWAAKAPSASIVFCGGSNQDHVLLSALLSLDAHLAGGSRGELQAALDCGAEPTQLVFSGAAKTNTDLRWAQEVGIGLVVVTSLHELTRLASSAPTLPVLVEISTTNPQVSLPLFAAAQAHGLRVVGVVVATEPTTTPIVCLDAVNQAVNCAQAHGHVLSSVHVVCSDPTVHACATLVGALCVPLSALSLSVCGWLGPAVASEAYALAVAVVDPPAQASGYDSEDSGIGWEPACTTRAQHVPGQQLCTISDGVYGTFSHVLFSGPHPSPSVLQRKASTPTLQSTTLLGPSGDTLDTVCQHVSLPELDTGDWLVFFGMGACAVSDPSPLNNYTAPRRLYVNSLCATRDVLGLDLVPAELVH